jgi:hypothetical protein
MTQYGARTVAFILVLVLGLAVWMFRWEYVVLPGVAAAVHVGENNESSVLNDSVVVRTNRITGALQVLMCRRVDRWVPSVRLARVANDAATCEWL